MRNHLNLQNSRSVRIKLAASKVQASSPDPVQTQKVSVSSICKCSNLLGLDGVCLCQCQIKNCYLCWLQLKHLPILCF